MFLNIQIDLLILKTYYGQFTLTTKKLLHIIFSTFITPCIWPVKISHCSSLQNCPWRTQSHSVRCGDVGLRMPERDSRMIEEWKCSGSHWCVGVARQWSDSTYSHNWRRACSETASAWCKTRRPNTWWLSGERYVEPQSLPESEGTREADNHRWENDHRWDNVTEWRWQWLDADSSVCCILFRTNVDATLLQLLHHHRLQIKQIRSYFSYFETHDFVFCLNLSFTLTFKLKVGLKPKCWKVK